MNTLPRLNAEDIRQWAPTLTAGDQILLSGVVYTARDAAHKKLADLFAARIEPPFPFRDCIIYHAGPTPAPEGKVCGSFGPTTSGRMDGFYDFFDQGQAAAIGKGDRNPAVIDALKRNNAVYLIAIGGAGALAAQHIVACDEVAFPELGCESVKRLVFNEFPLIVAIDSQGGNIYNRSSKQ